MKVNSFVSGYFAASCGTLWRQFRCFLAKKRRKSCKPNKTSVYGGNLKWRKSGAEAAQAAQDLIEKLLSEHLVRGVHVLSVGPSGDARTVVASLI